MIVHALDIETDTTIDGLDPQVSFVRSIAVYSPVGSFTAEAPTIERELALLQATTRWISDLPIGVIVTWNGAGFDLPFLADRWRCYGSEPRISLRADPALTPKYGPCAGHDHGYRGRLWGHDHADIAPAWKDYAHDNGIDWSLKPVARHLGLNPVEIDREMIHTATSSEVLAYNLSDTSVTYDLALRTDLEPLLDSAATSSRLAR